MADLSGKKIAFLVSGEGIEQVELTEPWKAVEQAGGQPVLVSPAEGQVQAFNHLDKADTFDVDVAVADASVGDYVGLVLPGGVANPDALRADETAVQFVRDFVGDGRPVAAICHAPWVLAEAGVLAGRQITSFPSLRTDLRNAGADVVDSDVVVDAKVGSTFVTSRNPDDLPAFCEKLVEVFADFDPDDAATQLGSMADDDAMADAGETIDLRTQDEQRSSQEQAVT